jgi:hypothetical protein
MASAGTHMPAAVTVTEQSQQHSGACDSQTLSVKCEHTLRAAACRQSSAATCDFVNVSSVDTAISPTNACQHLHLSPKPARGNCLGLCIADDISIHVLHLGDQLTWLAWVWQLWALPHQHYRSSCRRVVHLHHNTQKQSAAHDCTSRPIQLVSITTG